jgi:hypothetical protein
VNVELFGVVGVGVVLAGRECLESVISISEDELEEKNEGSEMEEDEDEREEAEEAEEAEEEAEEAGSKECNAVVS